MRRNRNFKGPSKEPPEPSRLATHDHEWFPIEDTPMLEDGAAIFMEQCRWAETETIHMGEYGTEEAVVGAECEESRSYRMELAWIEKKIDGAPNIFYLGSELDHFWLIAEEALIPIETRNSEITAIDPDKDLGYVVVENSDWRVKYKADCEPQIDPRLKYD